MSPAKFAPSALLYGFPRVSGDEPRKLGAGTSRRPFSPRERG